MRNGVARRFALLALLLLALLPACAAAGAEAAGEPPAPEGSVAGRTVLLDDVTTGLAAEPPPASGFAKRRAAATETARDADAPVPAGPTGDGERMLVYHGSVTVAVARPDESSATFLAKVAEWGGYLSQQQGTSYTVRLPAERFEAAFAFVRGMGRVLNEVRQANDVTEEFLDLGIRLENAKTSRERLLALLEKAEKVEDMLKIEEQLRRLTDEIERMEGRRKFLADQVAMATLTGTFQPVSDTPLPAAAPSRFDWIRAAGAERLLGRW